MISDEIKEILIKFEKLLSGRLKPIYKSFNVSNEFITKYEHLVYYSDCIIK